VTASEEPEFVAIKPARQLYKSPRRPTQTPAQAQSPRTPLPVPTRRVSAPVDLTPIPILSSKVEDAHAASRHVYFADQQFMPIIRRNTMPEHHSKSLSLIKTIHHCCHPKSSPHSSPPPTPTSQQPQSESLEDALIPDSDSSRHSSHTSLLRPSSRLHKFKLGFHSKPRSDFTEKEKPADQNSLASTG